MFVLPRLAIPSLLLLALASPASADDPTPEEIAEAGTLFASSCTQCHLPPDPEHPTDRAWLDQVRDTA